MHRLAYVAAIAGVVHYYMQVKADVRQPTIFAAVLVLLLGYRVLTALRQPKAASTVSAPSAKSSPATKVGD